ncbi:glycosyltransferase family 4 protein [Methylomarinum vadi]|uniref:glycosyltransferase family 4 protein n=1 Tax=Methylomarinum vadi TaxID=438855 RepID=UPI0004DF4617|nr:glycosyltransferase family 4 protein [Methylomarinum vadi]
MRVLYIHPAGAFGGASKSLIELYLAAKKQCVLEACVITPAGSAAEAFRDAGMHVIEAAGLAQFDHTRFGYYRNVRWLILLRELFFLPLVLFALLHTKKSQSRFDLIHVNEITLLPTAILARWVFRLPMIFHVRSLQYSGFGSLRSKLVFRALRKYATAMICIDETVRASIPQWLPSVVIHNGIDVGQIVATQDKAESSKVMVGMAGVLHRSKGIYEFLAAARILLNDRNRNIQFILAGENARQTTGLKKWVYKELGFSEDVLTEAKRYVKKNGMEQQVIFTGFIKDIRQFYPQLDVLCFPSHLNACGRPVFEAALFGIPSVVAIKNPVEDALIHKVTGLAIQKPDPYLLADAIDRLLLDAAFRQTLGMQAKTWAERLFSIDASASLLLQTYRKAVIYSSGKVS